MNQRERAEYLERFALAAEEESVTVHGYCLLLSEVHFVLTPKTARGLARLFHRVHSWWAVHFNNKHARMGHLFADRYHSAAISASHYWSALRYVELSPTRARAVHQAEEWQFSSIHHHLSGYSDPLVKLSEPSLDPVSSCGPWGEFLARNDAEVALFQRALRAAVPGSRPCGDEDWVRGLERKSGRKLLLTQRRRRPNWRLGAASG
jgi:putative transposase